jgi:hypothetical protein
MVDRKLASPITREPGPAFASSGLRGPAASSEQAVAVDDHSGGEVDESARPPLQTASDAVALVLRESA